MTARCHSGLGRLDFNQTDDPYRCSHVQASSGLIYSVDFPIPETDLEPSHNSSTCVSRCISRSFPEREEKKSLIENKLRSNRTESMFSSSLGWKIGTGVKGADIHFSLMNQMICSDEIISQRASAPLPFGFSLRTRRINGEMGVLAHTNKINTAISVSGN